MSHSGTHLHKSPPRNSGKSQNAQPVGQSKMGGDGGNHLGSLKKIMPQGREELKNTKFIFMMHSSPLSPSLRVWG